MYSDDRFYDEEWPGMELLETDEQEVEGFIWRFNPITRKWYLGDNHPSLTVGERNKNGH